MKTFFIRMVIVVLFLLFQNYSYSQVGLLKLSSNTFTPNSTDTIGAFSRIYYNAARKKFYLVYAARLWGQTTPVGLLNNFTWLELDSNLITTGNRGTLSGHVGAGDFAMVMVDSNYYQLTVGGSTALDYKLCKYDKDFNLKSSKIIDINTCESNIDQEMNYTNGRLIIGAMYDSHFCPPTNPPDTAFHSYTRIYQYDTSLNELKAAVLLDTPSKVTWGASMVYRNNYYYEVTMEHFSNRDLYAYKYDTNFTYKSRVLLHNDGQWSQGVLYDGNYFYVAHHTLDHNHGNVLLSVYDTAWSLITTKNVTTYPAPTDTGPAMSSFNANRPYIIMLGSKIYISYDVETYLMNANQKDWQAHVDVYQVNFAVPVLFNYFSATAKKNHQVELQWQTNNEMNGLEYIIQRSTDGISFNEIKTMLPKNASNVNTYSYTDDITYLNDKKVYYRIVFVEKDATRIYSKITELKFNNNYDAVSVFPNPVKDKLYFTSTISLNGCKTYLIEATGKIVAERAIENNAISLPVLTKGIYYLQIKTHQQTYLQKIFIQ